MASEFSSVIAGLDPGGLFLFFFQAEDGIRAATVTGVQTCALPIWRENVYLSGAILGLRRAEIRSRFDAIVEFAEVGRFLDMPVKHYSSGMRMRLAFAVAAHLEPEV